PGLVALTGATGVGKSLVLQALGLLAGDRASSDSVRTGCDAAEVRGLFHLDDETAAAVAEALGIDPPEEGELLLVRRIESAGRSRAFANGSPVTVAALRAAAPQLVEIHGQSAHQRLLEPVVQASLLDRFGGSVPAQRRWSEALDELRSILRRRSELEAGRRERLARIDYLEHIAQLVADAALEPGERDSLREEQRRFDGAERFLADLHTVVDALEDADGAAVEALGSAQSALERAATLDTRLEASRDHLDQAVELVHDAAREARRSLDGADFDPERRAIIEERLDDLEQVLRIHGPSEEDALRVGDEARDEAKQLRAEDEDDARAGERRDAALEALRRAGDVLVRKRRATAKRLSKEVTAELVDLDLRDAAFSVEVAAGHGDAAETGTASGPGPVEFLFTANPGEPRRPLADVASGGELARVALAIKTRLADADRTPTLVFDEIDAEVGGRLGPVVADRLRRVATGRQVLVVTHLASIAAVADLHLRVTKSVSDGRTTAAVAPLDGEEREGELAAMLRGKDQAEKGLEAARELLGEARAAARDPG
ncbi:MAG: DNA repair protein RecN, partial [Planctomycetota bacterium]